MDILEEYKKEITEDTKIDQINILDKQLMLPSLKHKWVSRLIDSKKNLNRLTKKKKDIKKIVVEQIQDNIPKSLPKAALDIKIEGSEKVKEINDEIEKYELLVDYLERVEKIFSSMSFDFKTATDLIKMETT
jgi:hypothetical protein